MRAFDTFVFCDWSASATPKSGRDSLWLCRARGGRKPEVVNPRTRLEAETLLAGWLEDAVARGERVLVGYDFPLGLPAVSYAALGFRDWRAYWRYLAREVHDGPRNQNNRFDVALALNERAGRGPGPFWGAPARARLASTKPGADPRFPDFREVEVALRAKKRRPFSVWQLLGNGSVGSQSMVGIPMIERLRQRLRAVTSIWPFESHDTQIVHAEAGPITIDVDLSRHPVRDAAQMISLAAWAKRADLDACLANVPVIARREGWVLGA